MYDSHPTVFLLARRCRFLLSTADRIPRDASKSRAGVGAGRRRRDLDPTRPGRPPPRAAPARRGSPRARGQPALRRDHRNPRRGHARPPPLRARRGALERGRGASPRRGGALRAGQRRVEFNPAAGTLAVVRVRVRRVGRETPSPAPAPVVEPGEAPRPKPHGGTAPGPGRAHRPRGAGFEGRRLDRTGSTSSRRARGRSAPAAGLAAIQRALNVARTSSRICTTCRCWEPDRPPPWPGGPRLGRGHGPRAPPVDRPGQRRPGRVRARGPERARDGRSRPAPADRAAPAHQRSGVHAAGRPRRDLGGPRGGELAPRRHRHRPRHRARGPAADLRRAAPDGLHGRARPRPSAPGSPSSATSPSSTAGASRATSAGPGSVRGS
jgi:hypothetical protein